MTSQRQIKFLLQIFLSWYPINFTGKLLQGWDKMRSTHNYPDMISIPTVPFFSLRAMCLPLYCTIRNKNHSLHRLKQPWDGGSQCHRFFGWSNLDVKESHLNSRCCQLVQWIKSPFTIQSAWVRIRVGWLFFCFVLYERSLPNFIIIFHYKTQLSSSLSPHDVVLSKSKVLKSFQNISFCSNLSWSTSVLFFGGEK